MMVVATVVSELRGHVGQVTCVEYVAREQVFITGWVSAFVRYGWGDCCGRLSA